MRKRLLLALVIVSLAIPSMGFDFRQYPAEEVGRATYTPNAETTLDDAPDAGVVLPASATAAIVCVETNPIRYFIGGSTAATGTVGLKLEVGCHTLGPDRGQLVGLRFIDSSAGASLVQIQYFRLK